MQLFLPDQIGDGDAQYAIVQSKSNGAILETFAGAVFPRGDRRGFRDFGRVAGRTQDQGQCFD